MRLDPTTFVMVIFGVFVVWADVALAHEEGANFSGAIIEPLRVHHAHIEDEQRANLGWSDELRTDQGRRGAFDGSVELATAWDSEFRFGSEIFIPISNAGDDRDNLGIGDIEVWPLKYAFINQPDTVVTGVLSFELPTGSESRGLGEGNTGFGALLFIDRAYRNWFFGFNGELERTISGDREAEAELAGVLSYSFLRGTVEIAPTVPDQRFVPALSLEVISEFGLQGPEEGETRVSWVPGMHLWHPNSGWAIRLGVQLPVTSRRNDDFAVLLQVGRHLDWGKLVGP